VWDGHSCPSPLTLFLRFFRQRSCLPNKMNDALLRGPSHECAVPNRRRDYRFLLARCVAEK
jgi:hypothetical protein